MKTQSKKQPIHPAVRMIIGRDCHVVWSYRRVIRHVISRLRYGMQTFREMPREDRRELMRQCIHYHLQNRKEYVGVMGGWYSLGLDPPGFPEDDDI